MAESLWLEISIRGYQTDGHALGQQGILKVWPAISEQGKRCCVSVPGHCHVLRGYRAGWGTSIALLPVVDDYRYRYRYFNRYAETGQPHSAAIRTR